ncbi:helix-turn-helix domain-containing protein [Clostridium neuense]|uniref:Helix-turn-helix domain-containing protein n=1 Tax=Clostridium neuense TaxID=1728934 RepID=A0ABW8TJM2_9CLOT
MSKITFGEKIKKLRIKNGFTLKKVENDTNLSASYINRLEIGERTNPSFATVKTLCEYYNISPIVFMSDDFSAK